MRALYRVFPHLPKASNDKPGGALYVGQQGGGRLDNPGVYSVPYLSDSASGAIAEAFGRFPEWTSAILEGSPGLPGSVRALVRVELPDNLPVCNLDDSAQLGELGLRPSDVVTRDYARSRTWSRRIYEQHRWIGVRWWSYYDPRWTNFGLWNLFPHFAFGQLDTSQSIKPTEISGRVIDAHGGVPLPKVGVL